MQKPTPYVSLHDVAFDFVDGGDVPFDDLVDGKGLCCPDDPLDEVMTYLSAVDDPFLAFKLDCSLPKPTAAAADVDSKSNEHMLANVGGGLDLHREVGDGDEKAGTPSTIGVDIPWLQASTVARKPRRPPATAGPAAAEYRLSTSPSFRSDEYSNRHRKVVKLRERKREKAMPLTASWSTRQGHVGRA
uniref:Uncharacterized protein n=1 Tax=Oryza punctata TaxID=4537 RepID=A0A0E0K8B5_ORYPU